MLSKSCVGVLSNLGMGRSTGSVAKMTRVCDSQKRRGSWTTESVRQSMMVMTVRSRLRGVAGFQRN